MPTIIATPGAANANSYETHAEANAYFADRIPVTPPWVASGQEAFLITATRMLEAYARPRKVLVPEQGGVAAYYRVMPQWTGAPATATQRLAWPRVGMFDGNGNAIDPAVIPQELKDAESELAGYLKKADRTLENDVIAQGITSLRAGSVSLAFKENLVQQVIPPAVYALMPYGWLTDELVVPALAAQFDVASNASQPWPGGGEVW
jgi:hypothetical protein